MGASFFSYIVGSVCGTMAKITERETGFQELMNSLNDFIREADLDWELARRLRAYFRFAEISDKTRRGSRPRRRDCAGWHPTP